MIYNTEVYSLNLNKIKGKDYVTALNNLNYGSGIQNLEFVIAKPNFSVIDKISPTCKKTLTSVHLSINFISVEGFDNLSVNLVDSFNSIVNTNMNKFVDIIFNADQFQSHFNSYFDGLNKNNDYYLFSLIEN